MDRKVKEKVKHIEYEYLYDELDIKEKEIEKLKESLKYVNHLYKKQTANAVKMLEENNTLALELEKKKEDLANIKQTKYEKGCEKYNKTVDEIAKAASKHREMNLALKEVLDAQKEKVFCLRGHRNELFDEIDKLNREHNIEIKYRNEKLSSLQEENVVIKGQLND